MKVNEIFESIQGEGRFVGHPALFIRLSGCNRLCSYCDTKYHKEAKEISVQKVINIINNSNKDIVVWTGGEPLLQFDDIKLVIDETRQLHHLETNGDLKLNFVYFNYIAFSPKTLTSAMKIKRLTADWSKNLYDIKVVTDLKLNKKLIPFATMLMSLTIIDKNKLQGEIDSKFIQQQVWKYCVKYNIKYSARLHISVWGLRRDV